ESPKRPVRERQGRLQKVQREVPFSRQTRFFLCSLLTINSACVLKGSNNAMNGQSSCLPIEDQNGPLMILNMAKAEVLLQGVPISSLWNSSVAEVDEHIEHTILGK
ncbi:hypothetical protein LOAG_09439, partial [Loa loa]